jgi:hypothetical protein
VSLAFKGKWTSEVLSMHLVIVIIHLAAVIEILLGEFMPPLNM